MTLVEYCNHNAHQLAACSSWSSSSSFDRGTVLWLYNPCAMSCSASGFFCPVDFLIFARLFWNQILICASFSPSSALNCCRLFSVKYRFSLNSCCNHNDQCWFLLNFMVVHYSHLQSRKLRSWKCRSRPLFIFRLQARIRWRFFRSFNSRTYVRKSINVNVFATLKG